MLRTLLPLRVWPSLDRLRRDVEHIIIDLDQGEISPAEVPIYYEDISGIANTILPTRIRVLGQLFVM